MPFVSLPRMLGGCPVSELRVFWGRGGIDIILLESWLHHAPVWTFKHTHKQLHTLSQSPSHLLNTLIALPLVRHYQRCCVLSSPCSTSRVFYWPRRCIWVFSLSGPTIWSVSPRGVSTRTSNFSKRPAIVLVELSEVNAGLCTPPVLSSVAHINSKSSRWQHGCHMHPCVLHCSLLALLKQWLWLT